MGKRHELKWHPQAPLRNGPQTREVMKRKHDEQRDEVGRQPFNKRQRNAMKPPAESSPTTTLLDEIRTLGGDEDDLRLVADAPSDSEQEMQEPPKTIDEKLRRELTNFAKDLGFDQFSRHPQASSGDKEVEEEAEKDDDDDDSRSTDDGRMEQLKIRSRIVEPRPDWFSDPAASGLDILPSPKDDNMSLYAPAVNGLKSYAESVWEREAAAYISSRAASSSHKFLSTIMASGTMSDKVSALTLAIQESPLYNVKALENLVTMASKRSRSQAIVALSALVDLFGPGLLLPPDRRLRRLHSQPGLLGTLQKHHINSWKTGNHLPGNLTDAHLICWWFEDWLKDAFFKTVQLLETWLNDEVEHSRLKALDFVFTLLREKPEQESNLLRLLVHKLGDLKRKVASHASYLILHLLESHPAMKTVVIKSVEQEILLHPSQPTRAKYYAITTLNQTVLSYKEPKIADLLQAVYFAVFLSVLKDQGLRGKEGEEDTAAVAASQPKKKGDKGQGKSKSDRKQPNLDSNDKLVSALLTGVNRAVPFSNADNATLESHVNTLFRITHSSNFNTSIQALILIQQISLSSGVSVDRFYRTLYESLLDPRLVSSSKQALYLNLLFKALKTDSSTRRIKAFIKRMIQIISLHQPPFICGMIYLVSELQKLFPDLAMLVEEPEATAEEGAVNALRSSYDGRKRDPEFSNAHESCLWEVLPYSHHFHPSASLFASAFLSKQKDLQKPELASHTLIHFLDRFVFRNPKTTESSRGTSIMQPAASVAGSAKLLASQKIESSNATAVNVPAFWNKKVGEVAAEDAFFHNYFSYAGKQKQLEKQKKRKRDEPVDESGDEEEDEDVWNALVSSHPELGEVDDDDSSMGDLDDAISDLSIELNDDDEEEDNEGLDDQNGAEEGVDMDLAFIDSNNGGVLGAGDNSDGGSDGASVREVTTATTAKALVGSKDLKARRKLMKNLPVFASVDDYEELLGMEDGLSG